MVRQAKTDDELIDIARVLFVELRSKALEGKYVIFPPAGINLAEKQISVAGLLSGLQAGLVNNVAGLSFQSEMPQNIDLGEALRLFGATLYHLDVGKSEYNWESFLLDGYKFPPRSEKMKPLIWDLLNNKEVDLDRIADRLGLKAKVKADAISPKKEDIVKREEVSPVVTSTGVLPVVGARPATELKMIGYDKVINFWGVNASRDLQIRYSQTTLSQAAADNQNGENWILVYYTGQSLREMQDKLRFFKDNLICFSEESTGWLSAKENSWANEKKEAGYYLLNFNGKFGGQIWKAQNRSIDELGEKYKRTSEPIVAEAVLSNLSINGDELLGRGYSHWGDKSDSNGRRVQIKFSEKGVSVESCNPFNRDEKNYVIIARKFDF